MKKKSLFKASFEESLNLEDNEISGTFAKKNLESAQEKEKYRGTLKSYVWLTILIILFVVGPNWLIALGNNYLFYHANPSDLTVPLSKYNLFPFQVFWIGLVLWLLLIVIGKRFNQTFILIYRGQFHLFMTFLPWLVLESNLLIINLLFASLGFLGISFVLIFILLCCYFIVRSAKSSLLRTIYANKEEQSKTSMEKIIQFFMKYGWFVVTIGIVINIFFRPVTATPVDWMVVLFTLIILLAMNIAFVAAESFLFFPFFLQGYYKLKYPEEYRQWEGKNLEEWYGKKYLKKHKELLKNE